MSTIRLFAGRPTPLLGARADSRRGVIAVLGSLFMCALFAFLALSVDTGRMVLTQTEMQNAVDAAALAASQEISLGLGGEGSSFAAAEAAARTVAAEVAEANGVYVNADQDVFFGLRTYNANSDTWSTQWGVTPFNVVRVVARRDNKDDLEAEDGELPLSFGWAVGQESVGLAAEATAFIESRDLVLVLDFSGSMSDDVELRSMNKMGQSAIEDSLDLIWQQLRDSGATWPDHPGQEKFTDGFGRVDSEYGTYYNSSKTSKIMNYLNLNDRNSDGSPKYPFPQAGRYSDGTPRDRLSANSSEDHWEGYVNYVKNLSGAYNRRYGYRTLCDYLLQNNQMKWTNSEDMWRTSHYPFHAVKEGATLFLDYLQEMDFGDEVGLVSYGSYAVWEDSHYDGEVDIDISDDPITDNLAAINTIQRRHQAGHYDVYTGMGDGVLKGREMLVGEANDPDDLGHARNGARPTMIVMTDGQANRKKSGWSLPGSFKWSDWTDYNGDGSADYSSGDSYKQYAFWEATEAVKKGITIHTMAVGAGADTDLMEAIAFAGGGAFVHVPGGTSVHEMEEELLDAFGTMAAKLPAAQLVSGE
ncbi:von Willebrand factor type A domain protein [Pseudobythopirellula maris]|uniref:von Willebrand factor type A domain protein n=1 Tax=Pseudobythopirellula maris TaxID=2527991 RepID=A0A5C5ZL57_9BACT|nr:vWA domain-containing protein [Pseudobythopirellula maris]TWT88172.1 von Willebrand factor type A domain protein [Pseudobythopirellula maris]